MGFYWHSITAHYVKFLFSSICQRGVVQCFIIALFKVLGLKKKEEDSSLFKHSVDVEKMKCAVVHVLMVFLYRNCSI